MQYAIPYAYIHQSIYINNSYTDRQIDSQLDTDSRLGTR